MCYYDYNDDDQMAEAYHRDQRKLNRGKRRHTCPDCGRENALTDEELRRGYHCSRCTAITEQGF